MSNDDRANNFLISLPWVEDGKCHNDASKDHVFFYPKGKPSRKDGVKVEDVEGQRARYCHGLDDGVMCPVRIKCLEHALENREFGVWGGMTETERDQLRRSRVSKKRKSA